MYGLPADARREPSPQGSRHGHGRPPEAPPGIVLSFGRAISSYIGWSPPETTALPPLTTSGPHVDDDDGHADGEVHHPSAAVPGLEASNVVAQHNDLRLSDGAGTQFEDSPPSSGEAGALTRPGTARPSDAGGAQSRRAHQLRSPVKAPRRISSASPKSYKRNIQPTATVAKMKVAKIPQLSWRGCEQARALKS